MAWRYREGEWVWNKSVFIPSFTLYLSLPSYTFLRLLSSYTFLLFSFQYLNSSSSSTVHAAYFSVCVHVVCHSAGHKAFWCMIQHTFHYQSAKSDPAFNLFITKLTDPCLKQAAIWSVFQQAHFTPTITKKIQKTVKNAGEIDAMFGVPSGREGHLRLSELYVREWLRPLMDRGHTALIGVITE